MELIWTSHKGKHFLITGFVHDPTEERHWKTMELLGEEDLMTVNGLEGSTDLPLNKSCRATRRTKQCSKTFSLNASQYDLKKKDVKWLDLDTWQKQALEALENRGEMKESVIWNAGVYLWLAGFSKDISEGIVEAKKILISGTARKTLESLITIRANL